MEIASVLSNILSFITTPFSLAGQEIAIVDIFAFGALLFGFSWLSRWVERFIHNTLLYKDIDPGIKGSIERFSRYIILIFGVMISLSSIGINLQTLVTFGTFLSVGIGFGLQNIVQNFISGLIILMERPIKKGDIVEVKGVSGRVLDIKARSTLILTRDDVVIIVPNSQFITEQVVNDSFSGNKLRLKVEVGVSYGSDLNKVTEILMDVAKKHEKVLQSPPPTVTMESFADSSINFSLRIWTYELWFYDLLLSELRYEIMAQFNEKGVTIPFPQRDLHIKTIVDPVTEPSFPTLKKTT